MMIQLDEETIALKELAILGEKMMAALSWTPTQGPDWRTFQSLFHPHATLVPAARPAAPITVATFVERMTSQRESGSLENFTETQLKLTGHVFGNVATVFQTYQTIVNGGTPGHGVSAMVWIRDNNQWLCLSMAWDAATADKQISPHYLP